MSVTSAHANMLVGSSRKNEKGLGMRLFLDMVTVLYKLL